MNRRAFLGAVASVPVAVVALPSAATATNPMQSFLQVASAVDAGTVIDNAYLSGIYTDLDAMMAIEKSIMRVMEKRR